VSAARADQTGLRLYRQVRLVAVAVAAMVAEDRRLRLVDYELSCRFGHLGA
jgi:hypothetical protein